MTDRPGLAAVLAEGAGTTRFRSFEFGAKTPWYRTACVRGGGTSVASRATSSSGVSTRKSDPPRGRFIR